MRKIESQMLEAIRAKKEWSNSNTRVEIIEENIKYTHSFNRIINVYLHNNKIAVFEPMAGRVTLHSRGWRSSTTKSRLNAILRGFSNSFSNTGIHQTNYQWFIGDKEFQDGMTIPVNL